MELSTSKIIKLLYFQKWNLLALYFSYISVGETFRTQKFLKINPLWKHLLYFRIGNVLVLKNVFYTLNKTPLEKTRCLSNLYYLLAAQGSSLLIDSLSLWVVCFLGDTFLKNIFDFFFFFFFLIFFLVFVILFIFFFIFLISFFEFFTFSKLLPQKIDFLNCFIKICIFKITSSNNKKQIFKRHFQNCLRKKYIFKLLPQKRYLWNFSLKKDIFEIAPS